MVTAQELVDSLRRSRSEVPEVEVKSAAGGFPKSLGPSLSALSNLPGGGWVILGIDEGSGFSAATLADPPGLCEALASKARQGFDPPIQIEIGIENVDGKPVVLGRVGETPRSAKPCRLVATGEAYMRFWDGDYRMSDLEWQGFLANRTQPDFDQQVVANTTIKDLDPVLLSDFLGSARRAEVRLAQITDDDTLLQKLGVVTRNGEPTVAGLLALGDYPQQWFPNFLIQAATLPTADDPSELRARDTRRFSGPIPVMLDEALGWAQRQGQQRLVEANDGSVRSQFTYPIVALRELLSNALVHRDLAPWSWSQAIEMRLTHDKFTLVNPGGLFGVTVDRLGSQQITSARNLALVRICQYVALQDGNVVEALASGIPRVFEAVAAAGLAQPRFFDQGLRFTAVLSAASTEPKKRLTVPPPKRDVSDRQARALTPRQAEIMAVLSDGGATVAELAGASSSSSNAVFKILAVLLQKGLVTRVGGAGVKGTKYFPAKREVVGYEVGETTRNSWRAAAASSGGVMLIMTPVPRSKPATVVSFGKM